MDNKSKDLVANSAAVGQSVVGDRVEQLAHDIFTDPAMAENVKDDPLFLLLKKWWRHLAVVAFAIVAGIYAKGVFEANRSSELANAADSYNNLIQAISRMPELQSKLEQAKAKEATVDKTTDEATKANLKKELESAQSEYEGSKARIESVLATLAETRDPYAHLAQVHRAILSIQGGDFVGAQKTLSIDRWRSVKDVKSSARFLAELDALFIARALLDSAAEQDRARAVLNDLANSASFVSISAAATLAKVAETAEQKAQAKASLEKIMASSPEQTDLVTPILEGLR